MLKNVTLSEFIISNTIYILITSSIIFLLNHFSLPIVPIAFIFLFITAFVKTGEILKALFGVTAGIIMFSLIILLIQSLTSAPVSIAYIFACLILCTLVWQTRNHLPSGHF